VKEQLGDKPAMATSRSNIGYVNDVLGNYTEALTYYEKSLAVSEEVGQKTNSADILTNIGRAYSNHGDYFRALECLEKALKLSTDVGYRAGIARSLNNIGVVEHHQANYPQAREYFQKSLDITEAIGDKPGAASSLKNFGTVQLDQGNFEQALETYQRALTLASQIGDKRTIAGVYGSIGLLEFTRGSHSKASEYYEKGLHAAEDSGDRALVDGVLGYMAENYYSQRDYARALEAAERSASIAKEIGDRDGLAGALNAAGKSNLEMGRVDLARKELTDAIEQVEQMRSQVVGSEHELQRFLERKTGPYYEMAGLLIGERDNETALEFAERAKARALVDVLESGRGDVNKSMTAQELGQEQALKGRIVSLNSQILNEKLRKEPDQNRLGGLNSELEKARLEYEGFQTALYAAHPDLRVQRGRFIPATLRESGELFPSPNTAIIEYLVSEDRTDLFVLTPAGSSGDKPALRVYTVQVKRKELADLTERLRDRLARRDAAYTEQARKLYDLLLRPAYSDIKIKSNLIIVPDGVLWTLPFQALESADRHFLIEDHAISYAPSLTSLREMVTRTKRKTDSGMTLDLLGLGNPVIQTSSSSLLKRVFMDPELKPLPQAETQVRAIGRLYGPTRSKIYVGAEATEDVLKAEAGKCRTLHIAGHGIVNNASPMYSQIVLARAEGSDDDGVLEAWEVMKMDLSADLVILSACDTAGGRVGAGEGMIGLSWAFFVAGCPSTVVSQWSVDADSTTELMIQVQRNLLSRMGKAVGLRRVEVKLVRSGGYSDPFYWAPFVIVGNAR